VRELTVFSRHPSWFRGGIPGKEKGKRREEKGKGRKGGTRRGEGQETKGEAFGPISEPCRHHWLF